jgi:alpha-L-arabinofuranosidase
VLADLKATGFDEEVSVIDALAAIDTRGALLLSIVHHGTGTIVVEVVIDDLEAGPVAEVQVLTGEFPWSGNTVDAPERITPVQRAVPVKEGRFLVTIPPFSLSQVCIVPGP